MTSRVSRLRSGFQWTTVMVEQTAEGGITWNGEESIEEHPWLQVWDSHGKLLFRNDVALEQPKVGMELSNLPDDTIVRAPTGGVPLRGQLATATRQSEGELQTLRVLAYDPYVTTPPPGVTMVELDRLLRESDVVSLHVPLTPETHHLFNDERFAKVKPGLRIINTARGDVVDQHALIEALQAIRRSKRDG